jgi:hypothetical protein
MVSQRLHETMFFSIDRESGQPAKYRLILGQKNYSSWSMRAWLLLKMLRVPFEEVTVPLYRPDSRQAVRALGGQTGLVPVLVDGGTTIWDNPSDLLAFYSTYARWLARELGCRPNSSSSMRSRRYIDFELPRRKRVNCALLAACVSVRTAACDCYEPLTWSSFRVGEITSSHHHQR